MGNRRMTKPLAICANLVDVRNIAAHKCVRLEIHVPVEQAGAVMEAFGWPTMVSPVPVAIARLDPEKAASAPPTPVDEVVKERRRFNTLPLPQQVAMRCGEGAFRRFVAEEWPTHPQCEDASEFVRRWCKVDSRSTILPGTPQADHWNRLHEKYLAWLQVDA